MVWPFVLLKLIQCMSNATANCCFVAPTRSMGDGSAGARRDPILSWLTKFSVFKDAWLDGGAMGSSTRGDGGRLSPQKVHDSARTVEHTGGGRGQECNGNWKTSKDNLWVTFPKGRSAQTVTYKIQSCLCTSVCRIQLWNCMATAGERREGNTTVRRELVLISRERSPRSVGSAWFQN